jgi:alpha-tubulin suppressor-like RCC1 family protein
MQSRSKTVVGILLTLTLTSCGARSELPEGGAGATTPGAPSSPRAPGHTVSASWQHTCAITSAGKVVCWGAFGSALANPTPTVIDGVDSVVEVAAGQVLDCARRADGTAWCWGDGTGGKPQQLEGATFSSIVAGSATVCGIDIGGDVRCAGTPFLSACKNGTPTWVPAAQLVPSLSGVAGIAMGQEHACAFDHAGATWCWGCGDYEAPWAVWSLGSMSGDTATPIPVPGVASTTRIAGETISTCAVQTDGQTTCWGDRSQFGPGIVGQPVGSTPAGFPPSPIDLDVGTAFACAAYPDEIRCLGGHPTFQDGCKGRVDTPLSIPLASVVELSVGDEHGCARDAEGQVWCWGCNTQGEVGDGTTQPRAAPVHVL